MTSFNFESARKEPVQHGHTSVADLLALRAAIDAQLPARALKDLNLEEELCLQFAVAREVQAKAMEDPDIPLNQVAQVLNTVGNTLEQLRATQEKFLNQERLKKIEAILGKVLSKLPADAAEDFINEYEKELKRAEA